MTSDAFTARAHAVVDEFVHTRPEYALARMHDVCEVVRDDVDLARWLPSLS